MILPNLITKRPSSQGFTLLEIVIALAIFMLFIGAILNTFLSLTSTQQKANLSREAMSEAKEILNFISQEGREKRIDYYCNPSLNNNTTTALTISCETDENTVLVLVSNNSLERILINKKTEDDNNLLNIIAEKQTRLSPFNNWQTATEIPLHSHRLKIQDIKVKIIPENDPYDFTTTENLIHPVAQVQLVIARNSQQPDNDENPPIIIQTAIASRAYNPQEL